MDQATPEKVDLNYDHVQSFVVSQLAKGEAKHLMYNRISNSKHPRRKRSSTSQTNDIDHAHELVECLPQGNRCTRPPREAFINLAKAAQRSDENAVDVIHNALLLEEYTIQLLQQHAGVPQNDECETVSAWALACSGIPSGELKSRERKMLKSKRAAAQLSSALSQLKALCDTRPSDSSAGASQGVAANVVFDSTRNRRRKRKRSTRRTSEAEEEGATNGEGQEKDGEVEWYKRKKRRASSEESCSSDNYSSEAEDGCDENAVQNAGVEHADGDPLGGTENDGFKGAHVGWNGGIDGGDEKRWHSGKKGGDGEADECREHGDEDDVCELVEVQERGDKADEDEEKDGEGEGVEEDCAPHGKDGVIAHGGRAMPVGRAGGCGRGADGERTGSGRATSDLHAQRVLLVKSKRAQFEGVWRMQRAQNMAPITRLRDVSALSKRGERRHEAHAACVHYALIPPRKPSPSSPASAAFPSPSPVAPPLHRRPPPLPMDASPPLSLPLPLHPHPSNHHKYPPPPTLFSANLDNHPSDISPNSATCPTDSSPSSNPSAHLSTISPLHRRHRLRSAARRASRPRKRQRCAPPVENGILPHTHLTDAHSSTKPSPNAHSSPEPMDACPPPLLPPVPPPPKLPFDTQSLNGPFDHLASPHRKQLHNRSLWKQIFTAYHYLNACPRTDPRFVPNKRPLDCLEHLRPSIFVTLLPDGYLRHDCSPSAPELPPSSPMQTMQSPSPDVSASSRNPSPSPNKPANSPKTATINAMPRYPYDRNSKPFLRCLDLGIIPALEDLPELSQRHYYDGCLIAEINDLRNEPKPMSKSPPSNLIRVLLRPDMSNLYQDLEQETCNLDTSVARAVERIIVKATSPPLNLHPRSKLTSYTSGGAVHTIYHAFNVIRKPRRPTLRRPPGPPHVPRLSTAALLLISAAEKQQRLHRNTSLSMRAMASELSTVATKQSSYTDFAPNASASTPSTPTIQQKADSLVANGPKPGEPPLAINNKVNNRVQPKIPRPRKFSIPSKALLHRAKQQALKSGKAFGPSSFASTHLQHLNPFSVHDRLRTVRLTKPGDDAAWEFKQACAMLESAKKLGGQALANAKERYAASEPRVAKPGVSELVVQMLRSISGSVEVFFIRSATGDKEQREFFRIDVASVQEGHALIDQVKAVVCEDGHVCVDDLSQEGILRFQQRRQQNRQAAINAMNAQNRQIVTPSNPPNHLRNEVPNGVAVPTVTEKNNSVAAEALQTQSHEALLHAKSISERQKKQIQHQQQMQKRQQWAEKHIRRQQQQQVLRGQLQRQSQIHPMLQQQQRLNRRRHPDGATARIDKNGMNIHRSSASMVNSNRMHNLISKGIPQSANNPQISQGVIGSAGIHGAVAPNLGIPTTLAHSRMFPAQIPPQLPAHLQQIQQQIQQQQLRIDHQQRGLLAHANPAQYGRGGNINAFVNPNMQTRPMPGAWVNPTAFPGARPGDAGRGVAPAALVGADRVPPGAIPPQFANENVEAQPQLGKR